MGFNFKKKTVVGVSINATRGLEVAQIDFETKTLLKYANRPLIYDFLRCEIADRDIFKELLNELLEELQIPKGSEIVLSLPTARFNIKDYSAIYTSEQIVADIEEDLLNDPIFQDAEASVSHIVLPISTMQFNKVASTVQKKEMLIEIAMQIKELGYKLIAIDSSVGSTLNALIYNNRVDFTDDTNWVLLFIENNVCRIFAMQGNNYTDYFEERISIGEVLGDEENYSTVLNAVSPIVKNLPAKCLYVISKTNVISAKKLADMLDFNFQIIHQEDNDFNNEPYLNISENLDENISSTVSLDVIGSAIYREFSEEVLLQFNLYNASLGDIYLLEQPLSLTIGNRVIVFSMQNMLIAAAVVFIFIAVITLLTLLPLTKTIEQKEEQAKDLDSKITDIQRYLNQNKSISTNAFDEGDEIRIGIAHNKNIYSYYTIVGTEIPKKLWLTALTINKNITVEGLSDNLESVYSFYRNIRDYNPKSNVKIQKLAMSSNAKISQLSDEEAFNTDSFITSGNADFYEFKISNAPEIKIESETDKNAEDTTKTKKTSSKLPDLEAIE